MNALPGPISKARQQASAARAAASHLARRQLATPRGIVQTDRIAEFRERIRDFCTGPPEYTTVRAHHTLSADDYAARIVQLIEQHGPP